MDVLNLDYNRSRGERSKSADVVLRKVFVDKIKSFSTNWNDAFSLQQRN
jgi:hypothetical protein